MRRKPRGSVGVYRFVPDVSHVRRTILIVSKTATPFEQSFQKLNLIGMSRRLMENIVPVLIEVVQPYRTKVLNGSQSGIY